MEMLKKFKEKATSFITKGQKKEEMHPSESFLKAVVSSSDSIIAVKDLDAIAQDTFDIEKYEVVIRSLLDLLNKEIQSRKLIKLLMISDYLLKYGCSGCVDDLRDHKNVFEQIQRINISESSEQATILSKKAKHILRLLNEKDLLCKEKVLSQQLKRKLLENRLNNGEGLYGQVRSSQGGQDNINQNGNPTSINGTGSNGEAGNNNLSIKQAAGMAVDKIIKFNDLVEDQFYKYLDDVNDKLDDITGSIGNKIDSIFSRIHLSLTSHQVASLDHNEENNISGRNGQSNQSQNFQSLSRNNQLTFELEDNPYEEPDTETIKISEEPTSKDIQATKDKIAGNDTNTTQLIGNIPPASFGSTKNIAVQNKDLLNLDEQTNIEL